MSNPFDDLPDAPQYNSGTATVFGLNPDGSVDRQDNGKGYYGANTRDPSLEGVSLPRATLRQQFGSEEAARGAMVEVVNPRTGQKGVFPLVDIGPAPWTGNALDLTYGAMKKVGGTGKDAMQFRAYKGPTGPAIGSGENPFDSLPDIEASPKPSFASPQAPETNPFDDLPDAKAADSGFWASAGAATRQGTLNTAAAASDVVGSVVNQPGKQAFLQANQPELDSAYARLSQLNPGGFGVPVQRGVQRPPTGPDYVETNRIEATKGDEEERLRKRIVELSNAPTFSDSSRELRADAADSFQQYGANPESTNPAAQLGRAAGSFTAAAPYLGLGLTGAAAQMAGSSYEGAYSAKEKQLRDSGVTDERAISDASQQAASMDALKTVPSLAAFMIGGKLASSAVASLIPETSPVWRGIAGALAGSAANVGVGAGTRAIEGHPVAPTIEQAAQDIAWGLIHGHGEYAGARERVAQRELQGEVPAIPGENRGGGESTPENTQVPQPQTIDGGGETSPPRDVFDQAANSYPEEKNSSGQLPGASPLDSTDFPPGASHVDELPTRQVTEGADIFEGLRKAKGAPPTFSEWLPNFLKSTPHLEDEPQALAGIYAYAKEASDRFTQEGGKLPMTEAVRATLNDLQPSKESPTSARNADIDAKRESVGLSRLVKDQKTTWGREWDEAIRVMDDKPQLQYNLINELAEKPRAVSVQEQLIVKHGIMRSESDFDAISSKVNAARDAKAPPEVLEPLLQDQRDALEEMDKAHRANMAIGSIGGTALGSRRAMFNEDYSQARLRAVMATEKGRVLTPEEDAKVVKQAADIKAAQETREQAETVHAGKGRAEAHGVHFDEVVKEVNRDIRNEAKRKAPSATASFLRAIAKAGGKVAKGVEDYAAKARERRKAARGQLNAGVDPTVAFDYAIIGADHIIKGITKFGEWANRMREDVGESTDSELEPIYKISNRLAAEGGAKIPELVSRIHAEAADGATLRDVTPLLRKLGKEFVRAGVDTRQEYMENVHHLVKDSFPDSSASDVMDALSGYGDFRRITKDEISVTDRSLRRQLQLVRKLEEIRAKRALKKSGLERDTPTDEERALEREINEAKKEHGVVTTDPETQLKSAEQAILTRLNNQIRDVSREVETGERQEPGKPPVKTQRTESRRAFLDHLRKTRDEILGAKDRPEKDRAAIAMRALERQVEEYNRRLTSDDYSRREPSPKVSSPELEAQRANRDAVRAEFHEMRAIDDELSGRKGERELAATKSRISRQIADMNDRRARGDFSQKPRKEPSMHPDVLEAERQLHLAKQAYNEDLIKAKLAARSWGEKVGGTAAEVKNLARAIQTSFDASMVLRQGGITALSHPIMAARALPQIWRAISEKGAFRAQKELEARPNYPLYKRAKLFLAEEGHDLKRMEENYASRWAQKIPGVVHSERIYTAYLNKIRADLFDSMTATLGDSGRVTPEEAKAIANMVNVSTGRGNIGKSSEFLSYFFFSPRFVASRFQQVLGQPIWGKAARDAVKATGSRRVQRLVAKEYAKTATGLALVLVSAAAMGAKVSLDPDDSDFLKIRIGNTSFDPTAGLSGAAVFTWRTAAAIANAFIKKDKKQVGRGYAAQAGTFARGKLAPFPGAILDLGDGKDVTGKPVTPADVALNMVFPMSANDAVELFKEHGIPAGVAMTAASELGVSQSTYDRRKHKAPRWTLNELLGQKK